MAKARTDSDTNGESAYSIRAVRRVCDILDLLQSKQGTATLAEVAAVTKLPKSSAFRYLATLETRRYVEHDAETGVYRLGLGLLPLGLLELDLIAERIRPRLEQLRDEYEETLNLAVLEGNGVTYLDIVESPRAMRMASRRGDREPIHSTALGKALAAELPEERVREILAAKGMPAFTERTLTRVDLYLSELQRVREEGFAIDDRENEPDGRCVAVAVTGARPSIAISLSAPISRLPRELLEEVGRRLQAVASTVAAELAGDRRTQKGIAAVDLDASPEGAPSHP